MAGRDARPDAQTGRRPETPSLNTRSFEPRATPSVILQCLLIGRREQLTDRTGKSRAIFILHRARHDSRMPLVPGFSPVLVLHFCEFIGA